MAKFIQSTFYSQDERIFKSIRGYIIHALLSLQYISNPLRFSYQPQGKRAASFNFCLHLSQHIKVCPEHQCWPLNNKRNRKKMAENAHLLLQMIAIFLSGKVLYRVHIAQTQCHRKSNNPNQCFYVILEIQEHFHSECI